MALFTISDLHLPLGVDKPMNIFGSEWDSYVKRLEENWQSIVSEEDTVVMPGDFSWATYIEQAYRDFEFLNRLNGSKILLKGNHDYWWQTAKKMDEYLLQNGFDTIKLMHNSSIMYGSTAICGNRGWIYDNSDENKKLYSREIIRLEISIQNAMKNNPDNIIVFTHFPPVMHDYFVNPFSDMLKKYGVKKCFYGHIHGEAKKTAFEGYADGIEYRLVSGDYLKFIPLKIL